MKIKLIDVDNRLNIKFDKTEGIYKWSDDNAYPQLIKSLIGSSVTAKNCVDINSKYIYGKGFSNVRKDALVNKRGLTLNKLFRQASREFSEQNNLFFHINYNALYQITSVELIPCSDARIGKSDSTGYSGKIVVYNNWDRSKAKKVDKKDFELFDIFNPNPLVIEAQVEAAGGWSKFKGQILHITADFNDIYSLSDGDSVLRDMNTEYMASVFKEAGLTRGNYGTRIFITKPFNNDYERNDFEGTIQDMLGVESTNGVLILEADKESDNLDDQFIIKNLESDFDDKRVEYTETSSAKKIRKAFGVPAILIEDNDNSIFGNSGELIIQAKKLHWEAKEEERANITEAFQTIFSRWHEPINPENDWTITPILTLENNAVSN
ncbi:hypothetical protein [Flavobacterium sp.]|uniref:hypothetical protein n=1 Tax=Flavobacterium sp. TaxID=239 RepID=UPI004033EFD5